MMMSLVADEVEMKEKNVISVERKIKKTAEGKDSSMAVLVATPSSEGSSEIRVEARSLMRSR